MDHPYSTKLTPKRCTLLCKKTSIVIVMYLKKLFLLFVYWTSLNVNIMKLKKQSTTTWQKIFFQEIKKVQNNHSTPIILHVEAFTRTKVHKCSFHHQVWKQHENYSTVLPFTMQYKQKLQKIKTFYDVELRNIKFSTQQNVLFDNPKPRANNAHLFVFCIVHFKDDQ